MFYLSQLRALFLASDAEGQEWSHASTAARAEGSMDQHKAFIERVADEVEGYGGSATEEGIARVSKLLLPLLEAGQIMADRADLFSKELWDAAIKGKA